MPGRYLTGCGFTCPLATQHVGLAHARPASRSGPTRPRQLGARLPSWPCRSVVSRAARCAGWSGLDHRLYRGPSQARKIHIGFLFVTRLAGSVMASSSMRRAVITWCHAGVAGWVKARDVGQSEHTGWGTWFRPTAVSIGSGSRGNRCARSRSFSTRCRLLPWR